MPADPFYLPPDVERVVLSEMDRRRAKYRALRAAVTPYMQQRAIQIAEQHPNASAGLAQSAVQTNLSDEQVAAIAEQDDGGVTGFIGDVVGFLSDGIETVYEQAVKPVIRGAFTIADTVAQEVVQRPLTSLLATTQGEADSFMDAYRRYGSSTGVVALGNVLDDDPNTRFDLGHGFFAGGQVRETSEAERTLTIGGQVASIGRALPTSRLVGEMFGYDSTAHDLVSGVSQFAVDVFADPLAIVTGGSSTLARGAARLGASDNVVRAISGGVSGARKAAKALDPADARALYDAVRGGAGAVEGVGRRSALLDDVEAFFGDRNLLGELAKADGYTIYQSFKRSAANHVDTQLIDRLGRATDESTVAQVLLDAAQRGHLSERGFYSGLKGFRRKVRDTRLAGVSARGKVSVDDLDDAADKLDSFLRQAKVDHETRAGIFERVAKINSSPWDHQTDEFFDVVTDAMAAASGNLGGELEAIKKATALVGDDLKAFRQYGVDVAGDPILTPFIRRRVDPGTGVEILDPTPQITSELLQEGFHLPDVTQVRRAAKRATRAERLYTSRGWTYGADAARWVTRDLFKPLAILRPAYVVRIGLEEQARLAAAGYDSLFNHPFRFIQANILAKATDTSLTGDSWEQVADALNAVNRRAYNVRAEGDTSAFVGRVWSLMHKGDEPTTEFVNAWRHELGQLSAAREARELARHGNVDEFVTWARETAEGRGTVERIARINTEAADLLTDDRALREWADSIRQRIAAKAGGEVVDGVVVSMGDPDILEGIATGRFSVADSSDTAAASLSNLLRGKWDTAPQSVKYDTSLLESGHRGRLNRAVDFLFDTFTGKPTNAFARYPAMRQAYIKNAETSMSALSTNVLRDDFVQRIDGMFSLTKAERQAITDAANRARDTFGFYDDLTELDEVLKVRSATEVKELLFDVTRRSNVQDAYEVALPFFDAWAEVTKTWARLVKENPAFFLRAGAGLESARESGVIYANDLGEEVFAYPGGGILSRFFPGDNAELRPEGRLQGANLVAQGVGPGFGPVVQWATGAFMSKDRDLQQLREWLAPFGTGGIESAGDLSDPSNIVGALIPAWARKTINALTSGTADPNQWNSTMGDVAKILAVSGEYDPANPTDQQRLLADAERGARFVLLMRGFVQGVGITGPSASWRIKTDGDEGEAIPEGWSPKADPDGVWHTLGTLASEYRRLREHYDYDDDLATSAFIDLYGLEPWYVSQAKTRSLANLPVDEEGFGWVREHSDAAAEYPSTIGYFVPPNEDAPLDYAIYRDQIEAGDRQSLTAEQQVQLANKAKAYSIFSNVRRKIEGAPTPVRDRVLSHTGAVLEGLFPGWRAPVLGVGESLDTGQRIEELKRAVADSRLADSPVAPTLRIYMTARDALLAQANARGVKTFNAKASADLRDRLEAVGVTLAGRDPAFAGVWSQLLRREVDDE